LIQARSAFDVRRDRSARRVRLPARRSMPVKA